MVIIEISNEGEGRSVEVLDRIFDPFYSTNATKRLGEDMGLGLSIAWHIVEAHGGRIEVNWTPGEGTSGV